MSSDKRNFKEFNNKEIFNYTIEKGVLVMEIYIINRRLVMLGFGDLKLDYSIMMSK